MQSELWKRVEDLFHRARSMTPDHRVEFLNSACRGDVLLQREVNTLLDHFDAAHSFLETSPLSRRIGFFRARPQALTAGMVVGTFEIVHLIGRGGMGEVYRASDSRLKRDVALKVLPSYLSTDARALCRFELEAQAAGRLNHPNIVAVYDIGMHEGAPYLVTELLEGESLRNRLGKGRLPLKTAIDYASQITRGLVAAHRVGITHRDIKPENLFITQDCRVKILDFGLATCAEARRGPLDELDSRPNTLTEPGRVLGTPPYMSPEQTRGEPTDHRSDVFSLGCVLYEMVTGQPAFQGISSISIATAILNAEPKSMRRLAPGTPRLLSRIVERCLSKDIECRWSAAELGVMLDKIANRGFLARKFPYGFGGLVLAAMLLGSYSLHRSKIAPETSNLKWAELTDFADYATQPSLSPDGRMLVFIRGPGTFMSTGEIYVKALPNGDARQLTWDGKLKMSPVFSPDCSQIAYTVPVSWDTWVVPVSGGSAPRLLFRNASGLTWISGARLQFSQLDRGSHMCIVTAAQNRLEQRNVYAPPRDNGMAHRSYLSPDGRWVLLAEMDDPGWLPCRLVPSDGSSRGKPVGPPGAACTSAAWSPDGRSMFFSSNADGRFHIWRQRFPDGLPEQITSGPTEEEGIAIAPDGRSLITSVGNTQGGVWVHDHDNEQQISSEGYASLPDINWGLAHSIFSPDGKLLYYPVQRGLWPNFEWELWRTELATKRSTRALPSFQKGRYDIASADFDISPDGERAVFSVADPHRKHHIWLASLKSTSSRRQLSPDSSSDSRPVYGPDGWVYFQAAEPSGDFISKMNEDGTGRQRVIPNQTNLFEGVSPDGRWVTAVVAISGEERTRAVMAFSTRDGSHRRICDGVCFAVWSQDGTLFNLLFPGEHMFSFVLGKDKTFPAALGPSGVESGAAARALKGARELDVDAYFAPHSSIYAFARETVRRNLYRIPVP